MTCDVTCWTCDALTVSLAYAYAYDTLLRPISRNGDTFAYNVRGEVVSATVGGNGEAHSYDHIGNAVLAASGGATNAYAANSLNQYTQVGRAAPCPPTPDGGLGQAAMPVTPAYDADGNLTAFGPWAYAYDAANRLVSVSSNGVPLVTNFYDAQSRRVRKVTPEATATCFYDGWNLVEERIAYTNGTTSTIHYYWGKDLSGKLQGAGGIGGLLYLTIDGTAYVPLYDNNGNVTRYLDANGGIAATYTYDAFGKAIAQSGPLADHFRHRFSTKCLDSETGLYYYGYRFYVPSLMRWLNRDPIGERGGENLYGFCDNNPVANCDKDGCAYFAIRGLGGFPAVKWSSFVSCPFMKMAVDIAADMLNVELVHEQLFYGDGGQPSNVGWSKAGKLENESPNGYIRRGREYDDCIMRLAQAEVDPDHYQLTWFGGKSKCNCQDYADALRAKYHELENDPKVKCKCKKGK